MIEVRESEKPSSGDVRRRQNDRRLAATVAEECIRMARIKRDMEMQARIEAQRMAREQLYSYEPWGKPGAGAPNNKTVKMTKISKYEMYPNDEIQHDQQIYFPKTSLNGKDTPSVQAQNAKQGQQQGYPNRTRSGRLKCKIKEDPILRYQWADNSRKAVDNELRYKISKTNQDKYKKYLDDLVLKKHRALEDETKRVNELEKRLNEMKGPWGKPGPGGTVWRNPRDIGTNFLKSMGWTDNLTFGDMQTEQVDQKRHTVKLPDIHKNVNGYIPSSSDSDDKYVTSNEMAFLDSKGKTKTIGNKKVYLTAINPPRKRKKSGKRSKLNFSTKINHESTDDSPNVEPTSDEIVNSNHTEALRNVKEKLSKRDISRNENAAVKASSLKKSNGDGQNKTPNSQILRLTGGIELVPLLARRRRIGAKTLPSSDVTKMQEDECQWREVSIEYLDDLTQQMKMKCKKLEENRKKSAENCKIHHETWSSLWGRPGHGAPRPGRNQRINLTQLLYQTPVY